MNSIVTGSDKQALVWSLADDDGGPFPRLHRLDARAPFKHLRHQRGRFDPISDAF